MTDIKSRRPGHRKIDLTHISFTQRYDILGNPIKEDLRHLTQDIWRYRINEEDAFKNELGLLDSPMAKILEWFYLSGSDNPRIRNREWLKRLGLTDTQITSLRTKSLRIWPYINRLLDFKNRLEYALYDLRVSYGGEVEQLKKKQGELCRMNEDILINRIADPNDLPFKNISLEGEFNTSDDAIREQAKQLARWIRERLEDEDEKEENYGKIDPLVYGVLKEFYYHSNWNDPRIENRESLKGKYTDAQITSGRRKALRMWPYVRLIMDLRDHPEGITLEGLVDELFTSYTKEVQLLKKNETILLRRSEELVKYNGIMSETNSKEKKNGS